MGIVVQKYGGSSVSTIEKIKQVAQAIVKRKKQGDHLVVVVSAMGDTTDEFLSLAKNIMVTPDKRELDALLSTGEIISSTLLAMAIKSLGANAISYSSYQIQIKTTNSHGKAIILDINDEKIKKSLKEDKIVIMAGFQGISDNGDITTLGRGGSDTTAVALACKLNGICEIYTDVDGIYTVDPREYGKAKKFDTISYEEILELASQGAQVMHPRAIELAYKHTLPIYVALSNSDIKGTLITEVRDVEHKPVKGIATCDDFVGLTLKNITYTTSLLSDLLETLSSKKIKVDALNQSSSLVGTTTLSFTLHKEDLPDCLSSIKKFTSIKDIEIDENITKFSVIGLGMQSTSSAAAKIFKLFHTHNIEVKMITTSEMRLTCGIQKRDKGKAIEIVAKEFNL